MASYATIPAEAETEKPLLNRDVRVNLKTVIGGAAVASFVLGALAAAVVTVKNGLLAEGSHIVGAPCTGHGGLLDEFQLWDIEGSTPAPAPTPSPPTPCGKPCKEDKDCNGKGGFFGNTCLVSGTRCAGHCAKRD